MTDTSGFSKELLKSPIAKVPHALDRIRLGKKRIQSVLDTHTVALRRTLEQKICEQGPRDQRIDPHLLGHAITDLRLTNRLATHHHDADKQSEWFSNPGANANAIAEKLAIIAPLHHETTSKQFTNLVGDALELIVYKALAEKAATSPRYSFAGHFELNKPKNAQGRYSKIQPPMHIHGKTTNKPADFLQHGHEAGTMCIECKNYREWFYPGHPGIVRLILRADELGAVPVLVARRLHYTTRTNFLEPAGIIAHETYHQYYPASHADLAARVRERTSLGFTDVLAVEEPQPRTKKFFSEILPNINEYMGKRWSANKAALVECAQGKINLAQLYNEIDSPAAGNWQEPEPEEDDNPFD